METDKGLVKKRAKKTIIKKKKEHITVIKKPVRRSIAKTFTKEDFVKEVCDTCDKQDGTYVAFINDEFALIVKKISVSVNRVVNPDAFQPYEKNQPKFFHTSFIIEWGDSESKNKEFPKLIKMEIPVNKITTPGSVFFIINEV